MSSALDQLLLAETKGRRATNAESQQGTIDAPERLQRQAQRVNTFVDPGGPNVDRAGIAQLTAGLEKFSGGVKRGADAVTKEWAKRETEAALAEFSASGKNTLAEYEKSLANREDPVTLGRVARNALESVSGVRQGQEAAASLQARIDAGEFNGMSPLDFRQAMNQHFADAISEVPEGEQFYFTTVQAEQEARLAAIQVATSNADTAQKTVTLVVEDSNDGDGKFNPETIGALQETIALQGFQASGDQLLNAIVSRDAALAAERGVPYLTTEEGLAEAEAEVAELMKATGHEWEPSSVVEDQVLGQLTNAMKQAEAGGNLRDQIALKEAQDYYALHPNATFDDLRRQFPEARPWQLRELLDRGERLIDPAQRFTADAEDGKVSVDPDVVAATSLNTIPIPDPSASEPPTMSQLFEDEVLRNPKSGVSDMIRNLQVLDNVADRAAYLTAVKNSRPEDYDELTKMNSWENMSEEQRNLLAKNQKDWDTYSETFKMTKKGFNQTDATASEDTRQLGRFLTDESFAPWYKNQYIGTDDAERTVQFAAAVEKQLEAFEGNKEAQQTYLYGLQKDLLDMEEEVTLPESEDQRSRALNYVQDRLVERSLPLDGKWIGPFGVVDSRPLAPVSSDIENNVANAENIKMVEEAKGQLHSQAVELNSKEQPPGDFFDWWFPYGDSIDVPDYMRRENRSENMWTRVGNTDIIELNPDLHYWPQGAPEDAEEAAEEAVPLTEAGTYDLSGTMMGRLVQRAAEVVDFLRSPVETTADAMTPAYMENKPSRN